MVATMTSPMAQTSLLRLEHVSLQAPAGAPYLLHDLSFEVRQGERLGIVGASGSGKTTLLRTLNRLSEISHGKIFFEGQEFRQIPVVQLRQHITLVPQESKLLGMTVRQALAYPLVLRRVDQSAIEQRVEACIERLHLPSEWLERTEVQLSVGQRQLVAIARALIIQPKVLLLDEPTSALDAGRGEHLLHVLQDLVKLTPTTILLVSHQLEMVQQFCSRLLYLQQGQLTQDVAAAEVNWATLKQTLIDEETTAAEEWA
jgi:D-methionine transport system ATP-binding protein